ncbi:MAG: hypothetical protein KAX18_10740, partial [Candidatus Lokiarchaeota archaeon]|nr:hypothetical protein [Candidatus Lokiarchaeota archaeon]
MNATRYNISNQYWKLEIQKNRNWFIYKLTSKVNNEIYADQDYYYRILTSSKRGSRFVYLTHLSSESKAKKLLSRSIHMEGNDTIIIEGKFEDTEILITHEFKLAENSKWLDEKITLSNQGKKRFRFSLINLGFRKSLFKQYSGWNEHLDEYSLTSIPTRRYLGYGADRRKENFSANDILFRAWIAKEAEMPGFCAEGWLWGNKQGGLLTCKYNPSQM